MFQSFFGADPMNAIEGHRYRDDLLRKGGSENEMKTLVEYLGRKPKSEAICSEYLPAGVCDRQCADRLYFCPVLCGIGD